MTSEKNDIYVYETGDSADSLYLNLTNRCSNACRFCVRTVNEKYYAQGGLWLQREPTAEEVLAILRNWEKPLSAYKNLVFCGFGEPCERMNVLLEIARGVRALAPSLSIRLNTNGQARLLSAEDPLPKMQGLIDTVSISLNAPTAERYDEICRCRFGKQGFYAMLDFARDAKRYIPTVILSVVDESLSPEEIALCRTLADGLGVQLRIREMIR